MAFQHGTQLFLAVTEHSVSQGQLLEMRTIKKLHILGGGGSGERDRDRKRERERDYT